MANHDLLILPLWYGCRRFCVGKQGERLATNTRARWVACYQRNDQPPLKSMVPSDAVGAAVMLGRGHSAGGCRHPRDRPRGGTGACPSTRETRRRSSDGERPRRRAHREPGFPSRRRRRCGHARRVVRLSATSSRSDLACALRIAPVVTNVSFPLTSVPGVGGHCGTSSVSRAERTESSSDWGFTVFVDIPRSTVATTTILRMTLDPRCECDRPRVRRRRNGMCPAPLDHRCARRAYRHAFFGCLARTASVPLR